MQFIASLLVVSSVVAVYGASAVPEGAANLRSLSTTSELDDMIFNNAETDRCTSIIVGPKAGVEGAMTTHTADCLNCDFRVGKVSDPLLDVEDIPVSQCFVSHRP
jgi:hypothetical protein